MTAAIIKRCSKEEIESKSEMKNGDKGRSKSLKAASLAAALAVTAIIFFGIIRSSFRRYSK